jgi:hypothetical protein
MTHLTDAFALARRPTAFLPVLLSTSAFAIVVGHLIFVDTAREVDEGTAAHLFQLLMVIQVPFVAVFLAKNLTRVPRAALRVLAAQVAAALAAITPVLYFNL